MNPSSLASMAVSRCNESISASVRSERNPRPSEGSAFELLPLRLSVPTLQRGLDGVCCRSFS